MLRKQSRTVVRELLVAVCMVGLLVAGSAAGFAAGQSPTKVSLRFDWLVGGQGAGFVLAAAKGYYHDVGLDVSLSQGKGSAITAQQVGKGNATFGLADGGTAAVAISKGVPIKVLAVILQMSPMSFVYHHGVKFDSPRDLKGKTVIAAPGDANYIVLPAVLSRYGVNPKDLTFEMVEVSTKVPAFLRNKNAVIVGFNNGDYLRAKKADPGAEYKTYAQFGVNPYGIGVIASLDELKNNPGVVRRFMQASAKGWKDVIADPGAAVDAILKAFPDANRWIQERSLAITLKSLHTPATERHPWGWMARTDWQATIELMHKYGNLVDPKPLDDYYTNEFVPQS